MPWDALPDNLNPNINPDAWKGTDDDVWYLRWKMKFIGLQAFGPRAKEWWAKWREIPLVLFAIGGKGPWRWEYSDGSGPEIYDYNRNPKTGGPMAHYVLSRVQYYKRWHLAVQWPFQITFHIYWSAKNVPVPEDRPGSLGIGKIFFFYGPTHRDADLVYWIPSFFIGGDWK